MLQIFFNKIRALADLYHKDVISTLHTALLDVHYKANLNLRAPGRVSHLKVFAFLNL